VLSGRPAGTHHVARRLGPGHRVVTVQVDRGLKYLAGGLYG
jgi:cysteine synthase A